MQRINKKDVQGLSLKAQTWLTQKAGQSLAPVEMEAAFRELESECLVRGVSLDSLMHDWDSRYADESLKYLERLYTPVSLFLLIYQHSQEIREDPFFAKEPSPAQVLSILGYDEVPGWHGISHKVRCLCLCDDGLIRKAELTGSFWEATQYEPADCEFCVSWIEDC